MLASYFLSRTIVPTMAKYLLRNDALGEGVAPTASRNPLVRLQQRFEESFETFRHKYRQALDTCLHHRRIFLTGFFVACLGSLAILIPWLGRDFFPSVDSGMFKLHLRAPTGMRIEDTAFVCDIVEQSIRQQIPASEVSSIIDNIGLPYSGINLSYSNSAPVGTSDADILVTLKSNHRPTDDYVRRLRQELPKQFPGVTFYFLPADMVGQILNFGLPAPIDVQIVGQDLEGNRSFADALLAKMRYIPGAADLRIQQPFDEPYLHLRVERTKAEELGFTAHDIAQNLLVSLSGSFQTSPTFWVDPKTHVSYQIATQTPEYRTDTLQDLQNVPISGTNPTAPPSIMASLVSTQRGTGLATVSHYNVAPVVDIYGSVSGRDLGGVSRDINQIIDGMRHELPRGSHVVVRGQVQTMRSSYVGLPERPGFLHRAGLFADCGQLPILARSVHHDFGASRRTRRNRLVSVCDAHNSQRSRADGSHHVHGCCYLEQHLGRELCNRTNERGQEFGRCSLGGRFHALSSRADDCAGHDHRHGSNGSWTGRWRRTECSSRKGGHRRAVICNRFHTVIRSRILQCFAGATRHARRVRK